MYTCIRVCVNRNICMCVYNIQMNIFRYLYLCEPAQARSLPSPRDLSRAPCPCASRGDEWHKRPPTPHMNVMKTGRCKLESVQCEDRLCDPQTTKTRGLQPKIHRSALSTSQTRLTPNSGWRFLMSITHSCSHASSGENEALPRVMRGATFPRCPAAFPRVM